MAIMVINLVMQSKVLEFSHDATDIAMSIQSCLYNIGIGSGALLGNQISFNFGMSNIGYAGALLAIVAFIFYYFRLCRKEKHIA